MKDSDFRQALQAALHADAVSETAQARTAAAACAMLQAAAPRPRIGFAAFLQAQVRFIGWKVWLLQALCLLVANGALDMLLGDYYFINLRAAALCLGALAVLVMLTALPFIYNAALYRMQEMEAASYFSSQRLLAAKLIIVGLGDGLMLAGLWGYALVCTPLAVQMLPLCLLLPFLLAAGGCLTLMSRLRPEQVCLGSVGWCGGVLVLIAAGSRPELLSPTQAALGGVLSCVVLALYCLWALQRLLRSNVFAELQLS